ncbi:hypothetical protein BVX97_03400 [bacterium E08(2017)]|nr:hypothetical protein BVX97_03400 [bacterium E08(2017)]
MVRINGDQKDLQGRGGERTGERSMDDMLKDYNAHQMRQIRGKVIDKGVTGDPPSIMLWGEEG